MKKFYQNSFMVLGAVALAWLCFTSSNAQTSDCLRNAQQKFNIGHLNEIPTSLEDCLDKKNLKTEFTIKEEEIQAFKLLTLVYIYLDDQRNANKSILRLLKSDPEHQPDPQDPAEFVYLYNKYSSKPVLALNGKLGFNFAQISEQEQFSTGIIGQSSNSYSSALALNLGLGIEYRIYKDFQLGPEGRLSTKTFNYTGAIATTSLTKADGSDANYNSLAFREADQWLDVPLYIKYNYAKKNIVPFIYAGFELNYLISSEQQDLSRDVINDFEGQSSDASVKDLLASGFEHREPTNYSILFGGGAKFKILRIHYFMIDLRYELGLTNVVKIDNRFLDDQTLATELSGPRFLYVDSDFKVSNFSISVGYAHSIYRTKDLTGKKKKKFLFF